MVTKYYAGHSFKWMGSFMRAVEKETYIRRSTAHCIAEVIHHQYVYKGQRTFKLSHKILIAFGVDRRYIKKYLQLFHKANLIKFKIEKGASPIITLILIPQSSTQSSIIK